MVSVGLVVVVAPPARAVADAVVSGTVVDSVTTQPLASVTVTDSTSGRSTTTAVAGTYSLSLPPGDHVLTATLAGYAPSSTPTLTLTSGQVLATQGFTLQKYASASGVVTEKGATSGIAGVVVKFFDAATSDPNSTFAATTGPDGSWSLDHLAPGTYKVQFDATGTDFLDRWYAGKAVRSDAVSVTVAAGEATVLSEVLLRRPRITGSVSALEPTLTRLVGAEVTATSQQGATTRVVTDANGNYQLTGLQEGQYQVQVTHPGYVSEWLNGGSADTFPVSLVAGDDIYNGLCLTTGATVTGVVHVPTGVTAVVRLSSGQRTTAGPDGSFTFRDVGSVTQATAYATGYYPLPLSVMTFEGFTTTLDFVMVPKPDLMVPTTGRVVDTSGASVPGAAVSDSLNLASATTGPDGSFALPVLDPANSSFRVSAAGFASQVVSVTSFASIGTVTLHRSSSLTGRLLLGSAGDPVLGGTIRLYGAQGGGAVVRSGDDGRYTVTDLAPGYYVVEATASVGADQFITFLGGAVSRALATYVTVSEGASLTGQDITIVKPGTLSGVVMFLGAPAGGRRVDLTGMGTGVSATSGADGKFVMSAIPPGTYRMSTGLGYDTTWWTGSAEAGGATEIAIASGASLTGYVLTILPTYSLTGTLRSAQGAPMPMEQVTVTNGPRRWSTGANAYGTYSFTLPPGTYELGYVKAGYVSWSPGASSPDTFTLDGDLVKDLVVPDMRAMTVRVRGSDGSSPYSTVSVFNTHDEYFAGALSTPGSITMSLPPGTFRMTVFALGYLPYTTQLSVTAASTVDVTLAVGGRISGATRGYDASVVAINALTGERFTASTSYPTYTVGALPPGDYVLSAVPNLDYRPCGPQQWYGGSGYLSARRLHVDSGTALTAIDFVLSCPQFWSTGARVLGDIALPPSVPASALAYIQVQATSSTRSLTAVTQPDGTFELSMVPGTYDITAHVPTFGLEGHATVTVEPDMAMILTLTMVRRGLVAGRVVGPLGEPVQASVSNGETQVDTDDQGSFSLGGVSYGSHTLTVEPRLPYAATFVEVTVGPGADVTGLTIHAHLAAAMRGVLPASMGSVEVTVTDASARVVAADYFTSAFTFTDLPPGPVTVRFSGAGVVTEWWRDAGNVASATVIELPEGGGVTDVTPNLRPAAAGMSTTTISGTVTYGSSPLGGVTVTAAKALTAVSATTAADGTYSLTVPRGDTYTVKAQICLGPNVGGCGGQAFEKARDVVADSPAAGGVDFVVPLPANSFTLGQQPVVSGRLASGQTLTATAGTWSPTPDSTSWQWYSDGYPMYGATGQTVVLTDAEIGTDIQVVVTQSKAGFATVTLPSEPMLVEVPGAIHALTPMRLLDSRINQGFRGPAVNGTVITVPVWGKAGVPEGASAVLMNLTVTDPTASGYVVAYASGGPVPWASSANFARGTTAANLSLVPVGADGAIALRSTVPGSVQVIADIQGYVVGGKVSASGAVVPVTPTRVIDTRTTQRVPAKGTIAVTVADVAGVPADATAVVANVTVTEARGPGYLTAWPTGVAMPTASNANFVTNQTVPNLAIVKIGTNKSISLYSNAPAPIDVIVDIQGYVRAGTPTLPGTVLPVTPNRVVDTRLGLNAGGPVPGLSGVVVDLDSTDLAATPQGALINLTVTQPSMTGYLSAYPYGMPTPLVSNLNFNPGMDVPNLSLATLTGGLAVLYNGSPGSVQMVADVLAYVL